MSDTNQKAIDIKQEKFNIVGIDEKGAEKINRESITYWQDAWRRFKENKVSMGAAILLLTIILFTIVGPIISGHDYQFMDTDIKNQLPSTEHWFGTDNMGRDLFSRVSIGGRTSIVIGISCAFIVMIIGSIYGGLAGYLGGTIDDIMMRIVEIIGSVPYLVLIILLQLILGDGLIPLIVAMTVVAWGGTARMVRGQVLQLKEQEFVLAEQALGASTARIIAKHLLPNTLALILVQVSFKVPQYIFSEAFLSYIGLGVKPPETSWGALASAAQPNLMFYPYQLFFPSIFIALTMLSFTLMGDGLTDALDPKLRK
ncbi:ABC transporter permease [Dethiothermospora halolimnae]|uniref:ABC transporter permease n=1 Tax=Dethiothermospora halolimnae TaxID=3114390 RepID=UPI003CCC310A